MRLAAGDPAARGELARGFGTPALTISAVLLRTTTAGQEIARLLIVNLGGGTGTVGTVALPDGEFQPPHPPTLVLGEARIVELQPPPGGGNAQRRVSVGDVIALVDSSGVADDRYRVP
jgi:hypothetical protein